MPEDAGEALAEHYGIPIQDLDGWKIAASMTKQGRRIANGALRYYAQTMAAEAVIAQARQIVGPMRGATRVVREPMGEPFSGELDIEATIENVLGKPFAESSDIVVQRREERCQQAVLMVDTSLSMAGENIAVAAVAVAVLALKVRPEDLAVVAFGESARTLTHLGVADPPIEIVRRLLNQPVLGATNIAVGLERGAEELDRGRNPRRGGLLMSDGIITRGGDPTQAAHRFPRLFVLMTEDACRGGGQVCDSLAEAGHGCVFAVRHYRDLPRRMLDVANRAFR